MTEWILVCDRAGMLSARYAPLRTVETADYLAAGRVKTGRRPYVLNLAQHYRYQGEGYYTSLLAEARGHRVSPSIETLNELSRKTLYAAHLPALNARLKEAIASGAHPVARLFIAFARTAEPGYDSFAKLVNDYFRAPALMVEMEKDQPGRIAKISLVPLPRMTREQQRFFDDALAAFTQSRLREPKEKVPAKWSLAILIDPKEPHPPSSEASLNRLVKVAGKMGIDAEFLDRHDLTSLAEFDALFIRATTSIDNFTYRFARRAEQEGMPVIDNPRSMIRCTNKVYLKEIMEKAGLPIPPTIVVDDSTDLKQVWERLGSPVVLKLPDGSFGVNMIKADSFKALEDGCEKLLKSSALIIAQGFLKTSFDWRVGVLDGKPLFASQYRMARGHWQIIRHNTDGTTREGGFKTFAVEDAPAGVVDLAVKAARLIGDGLYGVDIKETDDAAYVIEINDNPNLETDVEGAVIRDEMWAEILRWFSRRLEHRMGGS